jgi:hypothetical protein
MKDPYEVMRQKERELTVVRQQVAALHLVAPLLADESDEPERAAALPKQTAKSINDVAPKRWP